MTGRYLVKSVGLKPLHVKAQRLSKGFEACSWSHIRREQNCEADGLANKAMDQRCSVSLEVPYQPRGC